MLILDWKFINFKQLLAIARNKQNSIAEQSKKKVNKASFICERDSE